MLEVRWHNKFMVICVPRWVWTGSTNWTKTGLSTQANNAILIDDPLLATEFRKQRDRLKDAQGETQPPIRHAFLGTSTRRIYGNGLSRHPASQRIPTEATIHRG